MAGPALGGTFLSVTLAEAAERPEERPQPAAQVGDPAPAEPTPAAPAPAETAAAEPARPEAPAPPEASVSPDDSPSAPAGGAARAAESESALAAAPPQASGPAAAPADKGDAPRRDAVSLLDAAIERDLVYPPIARKRGIQGRVELDIAVTERGDLARCDVARTSGSSILDSAALRLLRGLFPFSGDLGGAFAARIAIEYRLD